MKSQKSATKSDKDRKSQALQARPAQRESSAQLHPLHSTVLNLQQTYGNRYVQGLIEGGRMPCRELCGQNEPSQATRLVPHSCGSCPFHTRSSMRMAPSSPPSGGVIQTKLKINKPGDIYEQEADRVADAVLQMKCKSPECEEEIRPVRISSIQLSPLIQKQGEIEEEEEEEMLQMKQTSGGTERDENVTQQILQQKGSGRPLEPDVRECMEARFGYDFGNVRVHADAYADKVSRQLGAEAFTVGRDVYFGAGKYSPVSTRGKRLLGHELTHIVQQGVQPHKIFISHISSNPAPMIQREAAPRTITDFESDEHYCKDTTFGGLLHSGVCFRQVVGSCNRGRHVCIDSTTGEVTDDHYDEFSPVERREPNGECNYHGACAYSHIVTEVPVALRFPYLRRLAKWLKEMV